ncbi:MAG: cation:proton antiporter, partial [Terriglobia bacterium]
IREYSFNRLILYGGLFSALVILLRLVWVFPGAYVSYFIRRRIFHQKENPPPARQVFVVGWTGMRGVIALAAAISLPAVLADGNPFPERNLIIFLTFSVILVTLVLQGLTLPDLIRTLGLAGSPGSDREEEEARRAIVEDAVAYIEEARGKDQPEFGAIYDDLEQHYRYRLAALTGKETGDGGIRPEHYTRSLDLSRELLRIERESALRLRKESRISDEVLRRLERELDLSEVRLRERSGG